jgi:hypothetical protein
MAAAKKKADAKPAEESAVGGEDGGEGDLNDGDNNGLVICAIVTIVFLMVLAVFDSMTTHFFKRGCIALADWTMNNAPGSFIIFEVVIIVLIVCCLPYGPLSLLSGALFYQKYGTTGVIVAWVALFIGKPHLPVETGCRTGIRPSAPARRVLAPRDSTSFFVPLSLSLSLSPSRVALLFILFNVFSLQGPSLRSASASASGGTTCGKLSSGRSTKSRR